ncbi:hypothetical protein SAY86_010773 [Trapa natans]|uniref:5'-adenylylsulfate reductase-like 5 n=1 Tax=Trapa natans TaxID=22666 RepID=A0AAN7LST7_TRANT|nr:hypothetical protein SAY86_010773 [Trapa natans]
MASPSTAPLLLFACLTMLWLFRRVSSATLPSCPRESVPLICSLQSQCPISISPNPPIQVEGGYLDGLLASKHDNGYTSILFHASWCPFSQATFSNYEVLSSMFPQISHLAVEQSSALPSIFSRYGIHSVPSILIVNQTSRLRYLGPKTLISLVQFYEKNTGLEPVQYITLDQPMKHQTVKNQSLQFRSDPSVKEFVKREPYLAFSIFFLCLRVLLAIVLKVMVHVRAFWALYMPRLNLEIFGATTQILGRVLPTIDMKRLWMKVKQRLCKGRSFHERARSFRVWAPSLASVSLGKSSSSR